MSLPQWRSQKQVSTDAHCAKLNHQSCQRNSNCYFGQPRDRRKFCFATKRWKLEHAGKKDGWCVFHQNENKCNSFRNCVWATAPCEDPIMNCKSLERMERDLEKYRSEDACLATPQWRSHTQRHDDGLCPLHTTRSKCHSSWACYWGKRKERRQGCFAIKPWKDSHPGQRDGWCVFHDNKGSCNRSPVCRWSESPCMLPGKHCMDVAAAAIDGFMDDWGR